MYEQLAPYYDDFMQADYERWIDYVFSFGLSGRGYDLGCGTGRFTLGLLRRGLEITGVDVSPAMLREAANNAIKAGLKADFVLADMTRFRPPRPAGFVTAMCDAVNYVKDTPAFFEVIYDALTPNGTFIFDISSEYKLKNVLDGRVFSEGNEKAEYIWKNAYNKRNNSIEAELIFYIKRGELYERRSERQRMYVHNGESMRSELFKAGFKRVSCYGGLSKKAPRTADQRLHFIARKGK